MSAVLRLVVVRQLDKPLVDVRTALHDLAVAVRDGMLASPAPELLRALKQAEDVLRSSF